MAEGGVEKYNYTEFFISQIFFMKVSKSISNTTVSIYYSTVKQNNVYSKL